MSKLSSSVPSNGFHASAATASSSFSSRNALASLIKKVSEGNAQAVETALSLGRPDPNKADKRSLLALHVAAQCGRVDIMRALVQHGARVDEEDPQYRRTALMAAVRESHVPAVKFLLNEGASPLYTDLGGRTAVHWAAICGATEVLS